MIALAFAALTAVAQPAPQSMPQPSPQRGRDIFFNGQATAGTPIKAIVGQQGRALPASLFPCASCHGEDGRGRQEGGISAANITRAVLDNAAVIGARSRPPYTTKALERAISSGRDAAGNRLDYAMPRYHMSRRDLGDLLAYLDKLGSEAPIGVSAEAIRINVLGAPTLEAPAQTIYGRKIVVLHERSADAFMTIDASADGSASIDYAERDRIPTIVLNPGLPLPERYAFVLSASKEDQVAALRHYAQARGLDPVLLADDCHGLEDAANAALVLMTVEAARHCDLNAIPRSLDRKIIVAAPAPPAANGDTANAQAQLAIVVKVLEQVGNDFSRSTFLTILEHSYRLDVAGLPPVTWTSSRHFGSSSVWLMTLDLRQQTLLASPGWSAVP
jgi:hypothetical protein